MKGNSILKTLILIIPKTRAALMVSNESYCTDIFVRVQRKSTICSGVDLRKTRVNSL